MKKFDPNSLSIALVTDSMTSFGGSDRLLFSILKLFPNAVIFTSIYNKRAYPKLQNEVRTTFLQKFRLFKRHLSFLFPLAFETLDFDGFDIVISLSAGPAKGILSKVEQPHVGIILTPPRHQWDGELNARGSKLHRLYSFISKFISHYLRIWDISAMKRVDFPISISKYIQKKTRKIYNRDSVVIYPGISDFWFEKDENLKEISEKYGLPETYLLFVGRLFDHKRVDWAIKACEENNMHLVIVGDGPDKKYLQKLVIKKNFIHFLGSVTDADLRCIYKLSACFVFPPIEDFGYVPVESMACGKPVLVFSTGGASETLEIGKIGEVFSSTSELSLLISKKVWKRYNTQDIIAHAKSFSEKIFLNKLKAEIKKAYEQK